MQHYQGRGLMEYYSSGAELAKAMGIPPAQLETTFTAYSKAGMCCLPFVF